MADLPGNDIILCQITSQQNQDNFAIPINATDFVTGSLPVASNIRPTRIFTADKNIIVRKVGNIKPAIVKSVSSVLASLLI